MVVESPEKRGKDGIMNPLSLYKGFLVSSYKGLWLHPVVHSVNVYICMNEKQHAEQLRLDDKLLFCCVSLIAHNNHTTITQPSTILFFCSNI